MKRNIIIILVIILFSFPLISESLKERVENLSKEEMQSVIEFLGDDLLEGRAPGTRGGDLSELYMKSLFKFIGLKPGHNGSYDQEYILKGFTTKELNVYANNVKLENIKDIIGNYTCEEEDIHVEGDAVFVGFGITTKLWNWDDFKQVDVTNKIIIARVNDPGFFRPDKFEGKTLTYFGRWTYHIEEAARRGAVGILLIHTDETAGYDWKVVENSWVGEGVYIESDLKNKLKFKGWIRESSLKKILKIKNINLQKLYKKSLKRRFKPIDLGFKIKIEGKNIFRDVPLKNVVAEIPGKSKKRIVLSAHIDHLGMNNDKEDNIFNGAIDNGSAVAAMMMVAKILKNYQKDLHYTITFLACNAEEGGMLGSKYYVQNTDRENIITNINFESTPVWEKTKDFIGVGARFSTLEDILKTIVKEEGLKYSYFSMANQGFFYRSDQYSFARYNIPAIWVSAGEEYVSGKKKYHEFWKNRYHTVKDEYDPNWELESMRQTIKIALLLVDRLNKTKKAPQWKNNLTFPVEK